MDSLFCKNLLGRIIIFLSILISTTSFANFMHITKLKVTIHNADSLPLTIEGASGGKGISSDIDMKTVIIQPGQNHVIVTTMDYRTSNIYPMTWDIWFDEQYKRHSLEYGGSIKNNLFLNRYFKEVENNKMLWNITEQYLPIDQVPSESSITFSCTKADGCTKQK